MHAALDPSGKFPSLKGSQPFSAGPYSGLISDGYDAADLKQALAELPVLLARDDAEYVSGGRNSNVSLSLPCHNSNRRFLVKSFGRQSRFKDYLDLGSRGSKAERSFRAAMHLAGHGVGTPTPVCFMQRLDGRTIRESYFISQFQAETDDLNQALKRIYHQRPETEPLMGLLEQTAVLVRKMHESGFEHRDLGNQNILLRGTSPYAWEQAMLIDLNRGRIVGELDLETRGRDLARLNLYSELMLLFLDMYWGSPAPRELKRSVARHRRRFQWWARTRSWRHPLREYRLARAEQGIDPQQRFPAARDVWLWDSYTDQPFCALERRERISQYPRSRSLRVIWDTAGSFLGLYSAYRKAMAEAFGAELGFRGRIGLAMEPTARSLPQEIDYLRAAGNIPLLLRFYHHKGRAQWDFQASVARQLRALGHPVKLALIQDRHAVLDPPSWKAFVHHVLDSVAGEVFSVEFGHAINRVKWGVWDFRELAALYEGIPQLRSDHPGIEFTGPGTIDFEYHFMISALKKWPADVPLAALSHHLYVDRRGAPENTQGRFNAVNKFALARAIARYSPVCADRVIVSEVNWPIKDTGVYSPVTAPFDRKWMPVDDAGVDEETYAAYMLRYLVLAIGSGLVDQVYWWRLVAVGYGLIEGDNGAGLRPRSAYHAFVHFLRTLGDATLVSASMPEQRGSSPRHGRYRFLFRRDDAEQVVITWVHGEKQPFTHDSPYEYCEDFRGNRIPAQPDYLQGMPVYLRGVRPETLTE